MTPYGKIRNGCCECINCGERIPQKAKERKKSNTALILKEMFKEYGEDLKNSVFLVEKYKSSGDK